VCECVCWILLLCDWGCRNLLYVSACVGYYGCVSACV